MDENKIIENQDENIMENELNEVEKNDEIIDDENIQDDDIEIEIDYQDTGLIIENTENIEIIGNPQQRMEMFKDWSLYFSEVNNPDNTILNTFFKAKYAPLSEVLNAIRGIMGKYGLSIIQSPFISNGDACVKTMVIHKSGAIMAFPIMNAKPTKADIQGIGSTITYIRRFVLNGISGVAGEVDDDGNTATGKKNQEAQNTPPKEPTKEEVDLKNAQAEIVKLATEKVEKGVDKDIVYGIISSNNNEKKNPNAIKDLVIAKKVIKEIKALKVEEKKENKNE